MGMNLANMKNEQSNDLNLTEQRFQELKTYMTAAEKDLEPAYDKNLDFAINSMFDRWKVQAGTKRDELKKLVAKMHAKRMNDHESRAMYRVLNANLNNVSTSINP